MRIEVLDWERTVTVSLKVGVMGKWLIVVPVTLDVEKGCSIMHFVSSWSRQEAVWPSGPPFVGRFGARPDLGGTHHHELRSLELGKAHNLSVTLLETLCQLAPRPPTIQWPPTGKAVSSLLLGWSA